MTIDYTSLARRGGGGLWCVYKCSMPSYAWSAGCLGESLRIFYWLPALSTLLSVSTLLGHLTPFFSCWAIFICCSQRSRNRRGASGSPRASFTTQQTQLSEAQVDAASSTPATLLPDAAAVAEPTEPTASISTAVETMNPSDHVGVLASVVEDNCASNRGVASTATSVAPDCDHGRGLAEGAGGEALAPSISSDAGELGVACEKDKVTSPLDVSTRGSCGGTDGLTAVAPPVVTAGQADPSAAGVSSAPDLLQPTPSRLPSLSPPSK